MRGGFGLFALVTCAVWADGQKSGAEAHKVMETLRNLMSSLEEEAKSTDSLDAARVSQCAEVQSKQQAAMAQQKAALTILDTDLQEYQAAVEEAQGSIDQINATAQKWNDEASTVQRITRDRDESFGKEQSELNSTILRVGKALRGADAKSALDLRQSLSDFAHKKDAVEQVHRDSESVISELSASKSDGVRSLQNELDTMIPLLSEKQQLVAETQDRLSLLEASSRSDAAVQSAYRDECVAATKVSQALSAARLSQENSLESAIAVMNTEVLPSQTSSATSLLQIAEHHFTRSGIPTQGPSSVEGLPAFPMFTQLRARIGHKSPFGLKLKTDFSGLADDLAADDAVEAKQDGEWCKAERRKTMMVMTQKKDSLDRLSAQIEFHKDGASQSGEAVATLDRQSQWYNATLEKVVDARSKDLQEMTKASADRQLEFKILRQASQVMLQLEQKSDSPDTVKTAAQQVNQQLALAAQALNSAIDAAEQYKASFPSLLLALRSATQAAIDQREKEKSHALLYKSQHEEGLAEAQDEFKGVREELDDVQAYMRQLNNDCGKQQKGDEALEEAAVADTERALQNAGSEGDDDDHTTPDVPPVAPSDAAVQSAARSEPVAVAASAVSGTSLPSDDGASGGLSPLQRAAMAMGVS